MRALPRSQQGVDESATEPLCMFWGTELFTGRQRDGSYRCYQMKSHFIVHIPSYTYVWLIFTVHVGKNNCTIHGCYGVGFSFEKWQLIQWCQVLLKWSLHFLCAERELPSAKITEQTQELVSSCCQNQNPLSTEITLSNFKTLWQLLYLHWKKNLLAVDCQTVRAQWLRSRIALSPWTRRPVNKTLVTVVGNIGFLNGFVQGDVLTFYHGKSPKKNIIWEHYICCRHLKQIQAFLFI